ncbi:MAG: carboxymuconolactone decarboxylase family protein [Gemmatimonadota bacterium]
MTASPGAADGSPACLPPDAAALVRLSAALAAGDEADVAAELRRAAEGHDPRGVEETIVQSCLFLGFPAALEAAAAWRRIRDGPATVDDDPLAAAELGRERAERGAALCRAIYGPAYEELRRNVASASPALDRLMVETGYGRVLGRPGLDRVRRELCLVAVLAVQGRDPQLHSHLRGALRLGAPAGWVEEALEIGLQRGSATANERFRRLWREVVERRNEVETEDTSG